MVLPNFDSELSALLARRPTPQGREKEIHHGNTIWDLTTRTEYGGQSYADWRSTHPLPPHVLDTDEWYWVEIGALLVVVQSAGGAAPAVHIVTCGQTVLIPAGRWCFSMPTSRGSEVRAKILNIPAFNPEGFQWLPEGTNHAAWLEYRRQAYTYHWDRDI